MHERTPALTLILMAAAAALLAGGCAEDEESSFDWEGVYTITSWTENPTGCDAEGPSVLEQQTETRFVAHRNSESLFGQALVTIAAGPCEDPQQCSDAASGGIFGSLFGGLVSFSPDQRDGDAYTTRAYSAVHDPETNMCTATVSMFVLSSPLEGQVRRERREFPDVQYAAGVGDDGEPDCLEQDAALEAALATASCGELQVIVANNPEDLPPPSEQ